MADRTSLEAQAALSNSTRSSLDWGQVGADLAGAQNFSIQPARVQLHSSQDCIRVTCVLALAPISPDCLSQVWVAEQHGPGTSLVSVHHPPAGKTAHINTHAYVTCMDACINGKVWMGHADGSVSMVSRETCKLMCPTLDVFDCPVTTISVDVHGAAWVSSQHGTITILEASSLRKSAGSAVLTLAVRYQLTMAGAVQTAGSEDSTYVHGGPVTAIQMYNYRCWTAGGSSDKCSIMEWNLRGDPKATLDVSDAGSTTSMTVLPQGAIQPHGRVQPATGPCWSVSFLEPLKLWCAAYDNGKVLVQDISALTHMTDRTSKSFMRLKAHPLGLTAADACHQLLVTAGKDGNVILWSMGDLVMNDAERASLLEGGGSLPADITGSISALRKDLLSNYFTPNNSRTALQAVRRALDRQSTPFNGWLEDSGIAKARRSDESWRLGRAGGRHKHKVPAHAPPASDGQAMDLLTELMRLMRPASSHGLSSEAPASPRSRRSSAEDAERHAPRYSSESSDRGTRTAIPLSSADSLPGQEEESRSAGRITSDSVHDMMSTRRSTDIPDENEPWSLARTMSTHGHLKWLLSMDQLIIVRKVAQGSTGEVYLARYQETDVAVKALRGLEELSRLVKMAPESMRSDPYALNSWLANSGSLQQSGSMPIMQSLEREVDILASIRHPNVVLFMGMVLDPPLIVSEWCSRGSVLDILSKAAKNPRLAAQLTWQRRLCMALDAAKGVYQLHKHDPQIIHADLKSPNLVVDANWRVKVTDFNLSRVVGDREYSATMVANNPRWQAPEVVKSQQFSEQSDVFSFAVVLWELHTMQLPWGNMNPFQIMTALEKGQRLDLPDPTPAEIAAGEGPIVTALTGLIAQCWAEDPQQRPSFPAIIALLRTSLDTCRTTMQPQTPRPHRSHGGAHGGPHGAHGSHGGHGHAPRHTTAAAAAAAFAGASALTPSLSPSPQSQQSQRTLTPRTSIASTVQQSPFATVTEGEAYSEPS
ncbi:hypothetical protein WJX73_008775 [Symbiochloris irregularis]|uniref:Protein kinase domain-containing protein n=1 Tax=Symbiochloris irregularis TaxID=706552 RepID=A0AAW1PRF9_9CHLO